MATIAAGTGTLINYTVEGGLAWIEMNDPPANTYTYEMMQQLDAAILQARMDTDVHVIILRGTGDKFFSAGVQILFLPARQRDSEPPGADAQACHRGTEWPHGGRRPGDCSRRRHPAG